VRGWLLGAVGIGLAISVLLPKAAVGQKDESDGIECSEYYHLEEERHIGEYTVSVFAKEGWACADRYEITITDRENYYLFTKTGFRMWLDPLTGRDITGEGNPDVIIKSYSGGAHCCYETTVVSLGPKRRLVVYPFPDSRTGHCRARFADLDGDGVYEVITCDDSFAYKFCSYADSPMVKVILKLDPREGYVPASPDFPWLYRGDIARHRKLAAEALARTDEYSCRYYPPKCAVLEVVLDLLYSGHPEEAWREFELYYKCPDRGEFRRMIREILKRSPLFVEKRAADRLEVGPAASFSREGSTG
jgi:hypothetical protein